MGTPDFAVDTLKAILDNGYRVVGVVTQPDKAVGRHGSILQPSAVKKYAMRKGLPVLQPEKMKDPVFVSQLKKLRANLQVVVAFRMLPEVVWSMPKYGTFNVHAAMLPQYRGAAPINWAIINGETTTGVTTFFLDEKIDTGRIIRQKEYKIKSNYNYGNVYNGLKRKGAEICLETLRDIRLAAGYPKSIPQDDFNVDGVIHSAPKIFKETCEINWSWTAKQIFDFVRGLNPNPIAWTTLMDPKGKTSILKVHQVRISGLVRDLPSGTISIEEKKLYITAANGEQVEIVELQVPGKKKMSARDFLNGNQNIMASKCVSVSV